MVAAVVRLRPEAQQAAHRLVPVGLGTSGLAGQEWTAPEVAAGAAAQRGQEAKVLAA